MSGGRSGPALMELVAGSRSGDRRTSSAVTLPAPVERSSTQPSDVAVEAWLRLRESYLRRYEVYRESLPSGPFPTVVPGLEAEEPVVVDESLAARLVDLYIVHGWAGVAAVEKALLEAVGRDRLDLSGGTVVDAVVSALSFFWFARNATAVVIQACLADLESRAARRVAAALAKLAKPVAAFRKQLGIGDGELVEVLTEYGGSAHIVYTAADKEFEETLHRALVPVVKQREKLDRVTARLTEARRAVRRAKADALLARSPYSSAPPRPSRFVAAAEDEAAAVEALVSEAAATLTEMRAVIEVNEPIAVLALPSMTGRTSPARMTQLFGELLGDLEDTLNSYRVPSAGLAGQLLPGGITGAASYDGTTPLPVPPEGLEAQLVSRALGSLADQPGALPLLHQQVWSELVSSGEVRPDGLSFAVHHWYMQELIEQVDAQAERQRLVAGVMELLGKAAAIVSLALLFLPPVSAALRGVALAVDLVLAGYALNGIARKFEAAEAAIAAEAAAGSGFETMAAIADLCAFRRDVIASLPAQVLLELAAIELGASSRLVKKLLLLRGYYGDVQVLLS